MQNKLQLGLDVGALAIKAVFRSDDGTLNSIYRLHRGNPERIILEIIKDFGPQFCAVAVTGAGGKRISETLSIQYADPAVALCAAAREMRGIRHIIDIGGASLSIVDLDEEGRFSGFRTNSLCAAGTGSFLDEQALRMNLSIAEMSGERAIANPPRIAARCAVFAKSDLIHRQQEGYSIPEMWSGLCRGMVGTALQTLFRGRKPKGNILLAGGVALNREVVKWFRDEISATIILPDNPETFSARGAIALARSQKETVSQCPFPPHPDPLPQGERELRLDLKTEIDWSLIAKKTNDEQVPLRPELKLKLSKYPSFECKTSFVDDDTEVRVHSDVSGDVVMGIDIGSTSTKAVIIGMDGEVRADLYRRTKGDPIGATQKILAAIGRMAGSGDLSIKGVGTTGSGRKMVGEIIGADLIINEITAHARGAAVIVPDCETIFEIGGQDAKFISLKNGVPHDSNMNYVCAAGTGSFVEEQAGKLGFKLEEIGDTTIGTFPPYSSDRCTVFMEQDVHSLVRAGFTRREVMGSVLYSVVQNYLNRVVGRRPYSRKKICFMGATARNKGLVAAFENLIGTPISVSPYCHVMGAFGVARIVLADIASKNLPTKFRGLSIATERIGLQRETCRLCSNSCTITKALLGDKTAEEAPSWGYMCGRDPKETRVRQTHEFDAFKKRKALWQKYVGRASKQGFRTTSHEPRATSHEPRTTVVGIPRALTAHSHLPFWSEFFGELGVDVRLSKPTHEATLTQAAEWIGADYCYPVKIAHGHVRELALDPKVDFIFLPYIVQDKPHDDDFKRSVYCPYNVAFPSIIKNSGVTESDAGEKPVLSVVVNFQWRAKLIAKKIAEGLKPLAKFSRARIERACKAGNCAQLEFEKDCEAVGAEAIDALSLNHKDGIVILGRPYNVHDSGSNLNLPQKVADLGLTVLSVDMLPLGHVEIDPLYKNMYWKYGRKILQAATFVARHPRLHAIYLTNFGCGPDSFLQTFVERIMGEKSMMLIEIDEHSADAGYITRLEAFRDVIAGEFCRKEVKPKTFTRRHGGYRTLWIPPMHPYGSPLLAAGLRSLGQNAKPLPLETIETFEQAKRFCRGTECVPAPATIGAFLNILKKSDAPERECFFMPSAKGPCRFGQYHTLHRIILDEAGFKDTPIEAWGDENGSYGLPAGASRVLYNAMVAADVLYKARCRLRPYATDRKKFDKTMEGELSRIIGIVENSRDIEGALEKSCQTLSQIGRTHERKPLIGIVGEIYVRLNPYTNGSLVETIEDAGGEAWVAPITEWFKYLSFLDKQSASLENYPVTERIKRTIKIRYMTNREQKITRSLIPIIGDRPEPTIESTVMAGEEFFPRQFDGESILTVGRAVEFAGQGVSLIINCAPFGCMPGTLTAGIFQRLEGRLGIPIVSLFFDGESDLKHLVRTYIVSIERVPK